MRVVGGQAGGRRLFVPKGCLIRPTSDRVKEALFNILHNVEGKTFLDLYAGVGSVGIESLSRGAVRAVFVEKDAVLAEAARKNVLTCGFEDCSEVMKDDAVKAVRRLADRRERFHMLFADPPYEQGLAGGILRHLADGRLLAEDAVIIVQHSVREPLQDMKTGPFVLTDQRKYGDTAVSFIKYYGKELVNCL
jgi:16S rRNA (guanine966-N2)-methyltransferase